MEYNLVSIPKLIEKGITMNFTRPSGYMEKEDKKIQLVRRDGLWAIPTIGQPKAAALRMQRNGTADTGTWYIRTAHANHQQIKMIRQEIIPEAAAGFHQENCEICHITKPMRRPVRKIAEHSGCATIHVDYIPMGTKEKGWRGEVGAYVFNSRKSKLLKVYPVTNAAGMEETRALTNYLTHIAPYMKENIECIQSDAGTQFSGEEWKATYTRRGMRYITCPIDHQAMNGQVERASGILGVKMRALLKARNTPRGYCPLALETAAYLLNRTPHTNLGGMTPLEASTGSKPSLMNTRIFGC